MREECGVFGIFDRTQQLNVAKISYFGIFALQHRGQESAGIAVCNGKNILIYRDLGLVSEVFDEGILGTLEGNSAIGHVRYSTAGGNNWENSQPILTRYRGGSFALAHNGHLINQDFLKKQLQPSASYLKERNTDSHLLCQLITASGEEDIEKALEKIALQIEGAFCIVVLTENKLIGLRDAMGFHPLVLGQLDNNYVIASEDSSFPLIYVQYIREMNQD